MLLRKKLVGENKHFILNYPLFGNINLYIQFNYVLHHNWENHIDIFNNILNGALKYNNTYTSKRKLFKSLYNYEGGAGVFPQYKYNDYKLW